MRIRPDREPYQNINIVRDQMAAITWRATQSQECQLCGWSLNVFSPRRLDVHHIVGGSGRRSDEPANFLLVCAGVDDGCHEAIHANKVDFDAVLAAKELCDPHNANRERIYQLKGYVP